jgi:hypothetical protein
MFSHLNDGTPPPPSEGVVDVTRAAGTSRRRRRLAGIGGTIALVVIVASTSMALANTAGRGVKQVAPATTRAGSDPSVSIYDNPVAHYRLRLEVLNTTLPSDGKLTSRLSVTNTGTDPLMAYENCGQGPYTLALTNAQDDLYFVPNARIQLLCIRPMSIAPGQTIDYEVSSAIANENNETGGPSPCLQGPGAGTYALTATSNNGLQDPNGTIDLLFSPPNTATKGMPYSAEKLAPIKVTVTRSALDQLPACTEYPPIKAPRTGNTGVKITYDVSTPVITANGMLKVTITYTNESDAPAEYAPDPCNGIPLILGNAAGKPYRLVYGQTTIGCPDGVLAAGESRSYTESRSLSGTSTWVNPQTGTEADCALASGIATVEVGAPPTGPHEQTPATFTITAIPGDTRPICPTS